MKVSGKCSKIMGLNCSQSRLAQHTLVIKWFSCEIAIFSLTIVKQFSKTSQLSDLNNFTTKPCPVVLMVTKPN